MPLNGIITKNNFYEACLWADGGISASLQKLFKYMIITLSCISKSFHCLGTPVPFTLSRVNHADFLSYFIIDTLVKSLKNTLLSF